MINFEESSNEFEVVLSLRQKIRFWVFEKFGI